MRPGVFVHIDKCGGTSMNVTVSRHSHLLWMHGDYVMAYQASPNPLKRMRKIQSELWRQAFKWAFVRNPWDRLVSLWRMVETRKHHQRRHAPRSLTDIVDIAEASDLANWPVPNIVQSLIADPNWNRSDDCIKMHLLPHHHPAYHIDELDFIGRFEHIERDWKHVCRMVRIHDKLPRINRTKHRHYSHYYDLRDRVARIYHSDIERFSYCFENASPSPLSRAVGSILRRF